MEDKEEIFKEYASNYLDLSPLMKLKLNHTLRVEKLSRRIAIEENFSDEEIKISTLCGLLHDIGRFEQFQRYSSFNDSKNEDHANLGVKVLMENNLINKFNENEEQNLIILKAIYNHNKYCIDEELSEEKKKITNLLRDADKLDILNLYVIKEINLNIGEETFSENMFNTLLNHQSASLKDKKTSADKLAISLGFVFDLIENLVFAIINAILSPKVLLLLEVNRQIMGGNWKTFTIEDLLKAMQGIIISIIKEVRDLVIQELLKLVLKYLQPLKEMIESILLREQIEEYTSAINSIIKNCPMVWFNFGYQPKEVKLDTVDYADIDINEIINAEKPKENC